MALDPLSKMGEALALGSLAVVEERFMKVLSFVGVAIAAVFFCAAPVSINASPDGLYAAISSASAAELPVERRAARRTYRRGVAYASKSYDPYCDGPYVGGGWMGGTYYGGPFIDLRCFSPTY